MEPEYPFLTDPRAMVRLRHVERTTRRMVASRYGGWREADRDDLVSVVLEKYFKRWGRGPGPDPGSDNKGLDKWLATVVKNGHPA